ncbi:unnamed protein product [Didymodactylos carnosus]|uniref:C3H1-type domain-containing protein n=1 Tax=Didymodactylos carnosus TaxID=1234261 RepID=A0A8S2GGN8_9BILA|nr:unnamed protein product [Didymodactylos carnosus]CAF3511380.1 unnamed protein product [Didymodactylos carnosus]
MNSSVNNTTNNNYNNEKTTHLNYLSSFRVDQCQLFLQHKCTQHRPFTCFHWHFMNQRRRRPLRHKDGTFCHDPDFYCDKYDEQSGVCCNGEECQFLHRNAGDTEKRYHLRYLKTAICTHETDSKGHCLKNGPHCSYAHGLSDSRQPVFDIREVQNTELALERLSRLSISLENERALNDDPKWSGNRKHFCLFKITISCFSIQDSQYVLANYKTESCKRPPRLCRQGYACPQYHNPRDRRRNPSIFKYKSTPCPHVKQSDEWMDPTACESGDNCKYCHTRTEQQFHPEIYKSTKCNDVSVTGYCPRGPFCAFAHIERRSELPLSSFIPIPEEKEVGIIMNSPIRTQKKSSQASVFEVGSYPGTNLFQNDSSFSGSNTFNQEQEQQHVGIDNRNRSPITPLFSEFHSISSPMSIHSNHPLPPPPSLINDSSVNLQFNNASLAAALQAVTTSHFSQSYPPLSLLSFPQTTHQQQQQQQQQNSAATNFITSIQAHLHSVETPSSLSSFISSGRSLPNTSYFDDEDDDLYHTDTSPLRFGSYQSSVAPTTTDVKNLIGLSLKTIGIDNIDVDEVDFDKASNNNDVLLDDTDNFDTNVHTSTTTTSPIPATSSTIKTSLTTSRTTLPVNIPNSYQASYVHFSQSPSKSPFDLLSSTKQQQQDRTLESPIDNIFPEPSTTGSGGHSGSYTMSGFNHDIPSTLHQQQQRSTSPQPIYNRLNSSNGAISSSSSSSTPYQNEIDIMRNRVLQMQVMAITQKEASDHWRREAEDKHRIAVQLEQEKNRAIQQRDDALHQIDTMRHLLTQNTRLLPSDSDLMSLPLDDVRSLQSRLKQELTKIALMDHRSYAGIDAITNVCTKLYPDQTNPLQATTVVKYWLGGQEPLDYISIYHNTGNETSPPHWHYITFGLTDLHGDGRVHKPSVKGENDTSSPSGYGFELTFRLKKMPENTNVNDIPYWPATMLQYLAKYIFATGNSFAAGHHIPFSHILPNIYSNGDNKLKTKIQDLIITQDKELKKFITQNGSIEFLQIVGCFECELTAAQDFSGSKIIELLSSNRKSGGSLLVTDMTREESIFELIPSARQTITNAIQKEGSHLGRALARCSWSVEASSMPNINDSQTRFVPCPMIQLSFDLDAAKMFLKILNTRLKRGKFFIFDSPLNQTICLMPISCTNPGIVVDSLRPIMVSVYEAQIMLMPEAIDSCLDQMDHIINIQSEQSLPLTYEIPIQTCKMKICLITSADFAAVPE